VRIQDSQFDGTTAISYAIVVCTKNRPSELNTFLRNLTTQDSPNLESVVVVDGSNDSSYLSRFKLQTEKTLMNPRITFLRTNGGKPTALNLSLKHLRESNKTVDAVVFLDDDIYFHLETLEIGIRFLKHNKICGLSPSIVNEGDTCFRIQHRNRDGIFPFRKSGVITPGGDNRWFNYRNIRENWIESEWLPGGAAIYDWQKIKTISFSEQLENPNLMGYALGDDVDFSMKARSFGNLGCLQEIQVIHSSPPDSYRNPNLLAVARAKWKAFLVSQHPSDFPIYRIILVEILRSIWHGIFKGKPKATFRGLSIFMNEFIHELRIQKSNRR